MPATGLIAVLSSKEVKTIITSAGRQPSDLGISAAEWPALKGALEAQAASSARAFGSTVLQMKALAKRLLALGVGQSLCGANS